MHSKYQLLNAGLFPETLPPCFVSKDAERAFTEIESDLDAGQYHERKTNYVRYNSTKHDGNRRVFGTPNIITYYHISRFIFDNWNTFDERFKESSFSLGRPNVMPADAERAIKVTSLSELSRAVSKNISHSPFIIQADISQFFHSIYTHSIPWAAHGIESSKKDTDRASSDNTFNALDFFIRNGQRGNTRGVLIGPDAYRLVAEFILSSLDVLIKEKAGDSLIGAVRHVDDYYLGLKSEYAAQEILSTLRDTLATFELNINDHKTKLYSSLTPVNDLWAQRLREHTELNQASDFIDLERAVSEAVELSDTLKSDSPIKILIRGFDEASIYAGPQWDYVEQNLQRIAQKHPHALDYVCLLVAKRYAIGREVDKSGWLSVGISIISRNLPIRHDHEIIWMVWLLIFCEIDMPPDLLETLSKYENGHLRSLMITAITDGKIKRKLRFQIGKPSSVNEHWLAGLVSRSTGFSSGKFTGEYAEEFEVLAGKSIKLVDLNSHLLSAKKYTARAISRTRYGYDDPDEWDYDDPSDFDNLLGSDPGKNNETLSSADIELLLEALNHKKD